MLYHVPQILKEIYKTVIEHIRNGNLSIELKGSKWVIRYVLAFRNQIFFKKTAEKPKIFQGIC